MSTVKIKTEPETAVTATVEVQVKLEPSFSTADIKLEQHSSDVDAKVESDSDVDSEAADIKSESDDDDDSEDTDQNQDIKAPKKLRQLICEYIGCGRSFNSAGYLNMHRHDHRLQTDINIHRRAYILTRLSLKDRWPCPIPDCKLTYKAVGGVGTHIRRDHDSTLKQQQQHHQHQPLSQMARRSRYFPDVDDFYVNDIRCGYHSTTGLFLCHECRLVPECLLTHLQHKHGYDEKSIDNSALPESAVNAGADPNINQHISNQHIATAISQPHQWRHRDIVQGWLCITSDCGYCGYTGQTKFSHKRYSHEGEQLLTVPALVLRLPYAKAQTSYVFIARLDTTTNNSIKSNNTASQYNSECDNEDSDQNEITESPDQKQQYVCEYPNCGRFFSSSALLSTHRREHKLEAVIKIYGKTFTFTRQSLDDRWACLISDCKMKCKTIVCLHVHIKRIHSAACRKRAISEDDYNIQQQPTNKKKQYVIHYVMVDDFYAGDTRCGYHNKIGVFICHECRLVPEFLLTHLQQKHGFDEKSIDNSALPESARINRSDPNTNQHTNHPHLAAAINQSSQLQHPDIVQGWLCVVSDCGYCCYTKMSRTMHQRTNHGGEQLLTVPALALRLVYRKTLTSGFLITRLDTTTNSVKSNNSASQYNSKFEDDEEDDGDELVLSDYSDGDDIH